MPESSSIPGNPSQSFTTSAGQPLSLPNASLVPSPLTGSHALEAPLAHVKSGNEESQAPNHPPLLPTPSLKAPLMGTSIAPHQRMDLPFPFKMQGHFLLFPNKGEEAEDLKDNALPEAGDPLPDFVCVKCNGEKEYLQVLYDWKPTACSVCATYGYNDAMCERKKSSTHASTKDSLVDPRSSNANPIAKVAATLVHKEAPANKSIPSSSNEEPSAKVDASPAHHGVPAATKAPINASFNPHQDRQKGNNPSCPHLVQNTQPVKENGKEVQGHQHNPKGVLQEAPTEIFKEVPTQSKEGLSVVLPRTDPYQEALPQKVSSEHSV
ncbi:hypothetical protein QJS04_geneDACA014824 [Acorus gramineus]|uniref:Uncharacterized protein n=1 Tax=Acorus gramineus TaxID=55184 RepID=A0AAV9BPV9_ACOGR|nr:hypothetical protein QJS04_geneDACA014824 [Acorus gramineus]